MPNRTPYGEMMYQKRKEARADAGISLAPQLTLQEVDV